MVQQELPSKTLETQITTEEINLYKDSELEKIKLQITYDYYKQQRDEMATLVKERSSVTLQILVIAGALVAVYLQTQIQLLQIIISIGIITLGFVSYFLNVNVGLTISSHMLRAKAARKSIRFLEGFASTSETFGQIHFYFYFLNIFIIITGLTLMAVAIML